MFREKDGVGLDIGKGNGANYLIFIPLVPLKTQKRKERNYEKS